MTTPLESTLAAILELEDVALDGEGCHSNTLNSGQPIHLRRFEDEASLLVTLPLGQLRSDHMDVRAFMLLLANNGLYLTGGGALGMDPNSHEVYLSRQFQLGQEGADLNATLGSLGAFRLAGEVARQYFDTVNVMEPGDEATFPGFPQEDADAAFQRVSSEGQLEESPEFEQDALAQYTTFVREAFVALGLEPQDPDEDLACYIEGEGGLLALVRLDPDFGELILSCRIGELPDDDCLALATEWLAANLFVELTGGCVLALSNEDPCQVSLSIVTSLDAVFPDPTRFANLISSFLQNCEQRCDSIEQSRDKAAASPESSPFQQFV